MEKISTFRLWVLFIVSVLEMFLLASPLLGWSSLLFVLKGERVFMDLCRGNSSSGELAKTSGDAELQGCAAQDDRLSLALTIACFVNAIMMFLTGWAIDKVGAKMIKIISSILYAMSAGLLALTTERSPMVLFAALLVMGVAYAGIYSCITRGATAFGNWQSAVNTAYNCAMQSSAVTFLIVKVAYEQGVPYQTLCYGFVGLTLILLLSSIFIFPDIHNKEEKIDTKANEANKEVSGGCMQSVRELWRHVTGGVFIWTGLFVALCRWRLWFFLTSFQQFMSSQPNAGSETVKSYANYYGIIQMCSLAMGPLLGALIAAGRGTLSWKSFNVFAKCAPTTTPEKVAVKTEKDLLEIEAGQLEILSHVTDTQVMAKAREVRGCMAAFGGSGVILVFINVLVLVPSVNLQILTFILISALRCGYNGGVSNLFLVTFPLSDYGKLMGISAVLTAAIQALQYPTFVVMETVLHGDILWINVMFLVLSIPLVIGFPVYLRFYARGLERLAMMPSESDSSARKCETAVVIENAVFEKLTSV